MSSRTHTHTPSGGWSDPEQVAWYTNRIGRLEARVAGEQMLVDSLPVRPERVLDLGCGDGRLSALVLSVKPSIREIVAVDRSVPMLEQAHRHFADEHRVDIQEWELNDSIVPLGSFDLIISGFAIHHLEDDRKRTLFAEVASMLGGSGSFLNLEVVRSATPERHSEFLHAIGRTVDDAEDRLATIEEQLDWMREAGLVNVDCLWRWRGFALLVGEAGTRR